MIFEEASRRTAYDALALINLINGRRPQTSPFDLAGFDFAYPIPSTGLPRPGDRTRASVGLQASEFLKFVPYMFRDLKQFEEDFNDLKKQVSGDCVCPNSVMMQTAIDLWLKVNASVSTQVSSTDTTLSLIQKLDASANTEVTIAFSSINNLLNIYKSCSQCLLTNVVNNGTKYIKFYCGGEPKYNSISNEDDKSCIGHGRRAISRVAKIHRRHVFHRRKRNIKAQNNLYGRVTSQANNMISYLEISMKNFNTNLTLVRSGTYKTALTSVRNTVQIFNANLRTSLNFINQFTATAVTQLNAAIMGTIQNATQTVSSNVQNFSQTIVNNSELYPCCLHFANTTLDLEANFTNNLIKCAQDADDLINVIAVNLTSFFVNFGNFHTQQMRNMDRCVNNVCSSIRILNFFIPFPVFTRTATRCTQDVSLYFLF